MSLVARFSSLVLVVSLGLTGAACASPTDEADSDAEVGTGEDAFTADIPKSERLLALAVKQAEQHAKDSCGTDTYRSTIVETLHQAIAVRNTVWFRTKVIPTKPAIVAALADTLEWQAILGTYDGRKPETFIAAANAGFSLWDTNGGAYGNQRRIQLAANGKATVHTLDTESKDFHWNTKATTWSYANGKLTLGTGATYSVKWESGMLTATPPGGNNPDFVSYQSECEA